MICAVSRGRGGTCTITANGAWEATAQQDNILDQSAGDKERANSSKMKKWVGLRRSNSTPGPNHWSWGRTVDLALEGGGGRFGALADPRSTHAPTDPPPANSRRKNVTYPNWSDPPTPGALNPPTPPPPPPPPPPWDPPDRTACLGGVFAQHGHSANYYVVYPGNTPQNHPPTEGCTIHSKQHGG